MSNLFSKLGELAQQAGVSVPGLGNSMNQGNTQPGNTMPGNAANAGSTGGGIGDLLGSLKDSIPGGVGGLLGAGALGGILGTLMSGKTARKVAEGALVAGGTAAAATLAWKFYQKWQAGNAPAQPVGQQGGQQYGQPMGQAAGQQYGQPQLSAAADPTAMLVLTAMVYAARADGYMDPDEQANVHNMMAQLFPGTDMAVQMDSLMRCPVDPHALARQVSGPEQARDVYRLSCMVIVADQAMERAYLETLAQAMGIDAAEKTRLEAEVQTMRQQM